MQDVTVITGGAGFIGCRVSQLLAGAGNKTVAIDNLHPQIHTVEGRPANLSNDVELRVADVRNPEFWDNFLKKYSPKVVLHLAAETGTAQSLALGSRHASVNVLGTTEMLDAFMRAGIVPDHMILTSSRAVYGEGAWVSADGTTFYPALRSHQQLSERKWDFEFDGQQGKPLPHRASTVHPNPSSTYGATKLTQENIFSCWGAALNVPVSILRLQNVYGPGQSPYNTYTGIINLFHRIAYNGNAIEVYEDGNIGRDFVFIDDVARTVVAAINNPPAARRVLDVGTGRATTIFEAATHIADLHGAPKPIVSGKFRDGDVRWAVANASDTLSELGIEAGVDFLQSGARIVGEWLSRNGFMAL